MVGKIGPSVSYSLNGGGGERARERRSTKKLKIRSRKDKIFPEKIRAGKSCWAKNGERHRKQWMSLARSCEL